MRYDIEETAVYAKYVRWCGRTASRGLSYPIDAPPGRAELTRHVFNRAAVPFTAKNYGQVARALNSRNATEMIPLRCMNFRMPLTVSSRDGSGLPHTEAFRAA
jgi:hypothetical protein